MSIVTRIRRILSDPPPEFIYEFSEAGIAWAHRHHKERQTGFQALEPGTLAVSPVKDNVLRPDLLESAVLGCTPQNGNKRRPAAIILPDFCGRITVLDFDSFPGDPAEQASLVRFRVKKSVPFDLDAASVSFAVQSGGGKRKDVVVAVVSYEILARYEAPLRVAGLHPGTVTISSLAAMNLSQGQALEVTAKLSGRVLSVLVTDNNALKMVRCVELDHVTPEELTAVLFPTFAFVEDELKRRPGRLILCGFGPYAEALAGHLASELSVTVEAMRSAFGMPGPFNAGLLGYLQSAEAA